jgi:hypothetical protein
MARRETKAPLARLVDVPQRVWRHHASRVAELIVRMWKTRFAEIRCALTSIPPPVSRQQRRGLIDYQLTFNNRRPKLG